MADISDPASGDSASPQANLTDGWHRYTNEHSGYSVDVPADWALQEQLGPDGTAVTTFAAPGGEAGLVVMARPGDSTGARSAELPNTRCRRVIVGGLSGQRCFDTIASSTSVVVAGYGTIYTLASLGKRPDPAVFERVLDSFQPG